MPTILKALLSSAGGLYGYLAVAVVAGVLAGAGVHKVDQAALNSTKLADLKVLTDLKLADEAASRKALQAQAVSLASLADQRHEADQAVTAAAVKEAASQIKIVTRIQTLTQEIPVYVKDTSLGCITYGLVRVLDARALAANGAGDGDPKALALPTGQSDDACAPVKATDLARSVADNYSVAGQNAEQLNALEASIADLIAIANRKVP